MRPDVTQILDFFTMCMDRLGYSAMNTCWSALSTFIHIDNVPIGSHPLIIRFMKGVFSIKPSLPKNTVIWDVNILMDYLKTLSPIEELDLKCLTLKAVTLTALLTGQRCQSIHSMDLTNMTLQDKVVKFRFGKKLKTTRPGIHMPEITVTHYVADVRLCLPTIIKHYVERTAELRGEETQLFITTVKPHTRASKQTIARRVKSALTHAGIDTSIFGAHSTRSAATSKAKVMHIPLKTIMNTAGWSAECTFAKHYEKPIVKQGHFANALLSNTIV